MKTSIHLSIGIGLFISFLFPIFFISINIDEFNFINASIFIQSSIITALCVLLLLTPIIFLTSKYSYFKYFLWYLLIWIHLSGYLFPLITVGVLREISEMSTNYYHLVLVSTLSLLGLLFVNKKQEIVLSFFLVIFNITSLGSTLPNTINLYQKLTKTNNQNFFELSKNKNIIVISFDGIPNTIFSDIISKNKEIEKSFKDFTFFDNIISQSPSTQESIRAELFGNDDYLKLGKTREEVREKLDFTNHYINSIENSYVYGNYSLYQTNREFYISPGSLIQSKNIESHVLMFKTILSRLFSPIFINIDFNIFKILYKINSDKTAEMEKSHIGKDWKTVYLKQIVEVDTIIENLRESEKEISIRYFHFTFSHWPVDFDENCNFIGNDKILYHRSQTQYGLTKQTVCSIKKYILFLDKLKKINVYENSYIVLKSDHGEGAFYFNSSPNNLLISGNTLGYNRYRPLLLIKKPKITQDSIILNHQLTTLANLSKTICLNSLDKEFICNKIKGIDLFSNFSENPIEKINLEIVKDEKSSFRSHDHKNILLAIDSNNFLEILNNNNISTKPYNSQEKYPKTIQRLKDLGNIKNALKKYFDKNMAYPKSQGWDGYMSNLGKSGINWIENLEPNFIDPLPHESSKNINEQFLYKSDGKDYKLIFHANLEECSYSVQITNPELVDPARNCWAYGYWTKNAEKW
jgi:hypothetical protein